MFRPCVYIAKTLAGERSPGACRRGSAASGPAGLRRRSELGAPRPAQPRARRAERPALLRSRAVPPELCGRGCPGELGHLEVSPRTVFFTLLTRAGVPALLGGSCALVGSAPREPSRRPFLRSRPQGSRSLWASDATLPRPVRSGARLQRPQCPDVYQD